MVQIRLKRVLPVFLAALALCVICFAVSAGAEEYGSFIYKVVEPGENESFEPYVTIVGYRHDRTDDSTVVHMPEEIESDPVKSISDGAFRDNDEITDVILPGSLEVIGNAAFGDCDALQFILIPDSVREIGDSAFQSCDALTWVSMGEGLERISALAFRGCEALQAVDLGNHVKEIDDGAFYGCANLKELRIPQSLSVIGPLALGFDQNGDYPKVVDGFRFLKSGSVPALDAYMAEPVATGEQSKADFGQAKDVAVCADDAHQADFKLVRAATDTYEGVELAVCSVCGSLALRPNNDLPEEEFNLSGLIILIVAILLVIGFVVMTIRYVKKSKARRSAAIAAYQAENGAPEDNKGES